jgi:hypothetical protein
MKKFFTLSFLIFVAVIFSVSLSTKTYAGECSNLAKKSMFYSHLTVKLHHKIMFMWTATADKEAFRGIVNVLIGKATQTLNAAEVCYAKKYANGDRMLNSYSPLQKAIAYYENHDVPLDTFKIY